MNILFEPRFEKPVLEGAKIHTIRVDYDYWKRYDGKECSFRVWTGRPYRSPQREFCRIRIGVQPLFVFVQGDLSVVLSFGGMLWRLLKTSGIVVLMKTLQKTTGFCKEREFQEWFSDIKAGTHHFAILHRADFRY